MIRTAPNVIDLYDQPGHLIRRAHQISVSVFLSILGREVTPMQYAALKCLASRPGIDQVTLAQEAGLDTSTTATVAVRLETKGWILRHRVARGQRSLQLTDAGRELLRELDAKMPVMQQTLLESFSQPERELFMRLLQQFVLMNNELSRAPLRAGAGDAGTET